MSDARDKTIEDFNEVLSWIESNDLDATVIGRIAVGKFAMERGISSMSGDLDLLVSPEDLSEFERLVTLEPRAQVKKRPLARNLPVLVFTWGTLEVDVLTKSAGLPSPEAARSRAWTIDGVAIADPVGPPFDEARDDAKEGPPACRHPTYRLRRVRQLPLRERAWSRSL